MPILGNLLHPEMAPSDVKEQNVLRTTGTCEPGEKTPVQRQDWERHRLVDNQSQGGFDVVQRLGSDVFGWHVLE